MHVHYSGLFIYNLCYLLVFIDIVFSSSSLSTWQTYLLLLHVANANPKQAHKRQVVRTAQLSQSNVSDTSANSHGPSERMDLVTALFLDVRKKVDQAGREGLVGIIWLFFSRYWHLERRREPSQRLVKPTDFSRTHVTSRPERARQNQGKRTPTKFSDEERGMGSHLRKRVNAHD